MQMFTTSQNVYKGDDWIGILIAVSIISLWFASLFELLNIAIADTSIFWLVSFVLGRTYLHTGLFILAHDAMHDNLIPHHKFLNNLIGRLAVGVYGFLPYDHCCINHHNHHRYASQSGDPDFHGKIAHPFFWYCKFMREYFPLRSLIIFLINVCLIFLVSITFFQVPLINLILFWIVPLVLSSLQLFFFGTYLPHRQVENNPDFLPRTQSDRYSILWSFLSCYNFGHYHWEHHEYPQIPWYRLHRERLKN